jgi:hypothetical protein
VFPINSAKTPLIKGFRGDRPYPVAALRRFLWDDAAAIGVALPGDQIALDIDVKDGKQGDEHLALLEGMCGALPDAIVRRTRSGGWHLLFYRGQIPQDAALASHCVLPDGSYAHIDIVHRDNRYLVVHDVKQWLAHPLPTSALEVSWLPALAKPTRRYGQREGRGTDAAVSLGTLDELVAEVAQATEYRNECLNRNLYLALIQGNSHPSVIDLFRKAAIECGLEPGEIERAITSALDGAARKQSFAVAWCRTVADHPRLNGARRRNTCMAIAMTFARHYLRKAGSPLIGMSIYQLSEECGFSPKAASEWLRDFQQAGLLARRRKATYRTGAEYELTMPWGDPLSGNTHPPSPRGGVLPEGKLFPTLDAQDLLKAELQACAAFIRMGEGPVFSPTCVDVLVALLSGPLKRGAIARAANRSWGAVNRAVLILHSAGIVNFDSDSGLVHLLTGDLVAAVDDWATSMGVIIRPELRRLMHQKQREAYRSWTESFSDEPTGHQKDD